MERALPVIILLAVIAVVDACSVSDDDGGSPERTPAEPTSMDDTRRVDDAAVDADSSGVSDAGFDSSGDGSADASVDSGEQDSEPLPSRHGLAFKDVAGERFVADLPPAYIGGGQTQVTWEGWFKHEGFPPNTQDQNGRLFAHGGENVYCQVVRPDPVATEAGKVECGLMQEKYLRSTTKVSGLGWFHVALTYNAGEFRLYLDGSPQGTATTSKATLPPEATSQFDTNAYGKTFFGAVSLDKYSTTVTVDEYRLSPSVVYGPNAFVPPKHLSASGADLLLMLDDGAGTTADNGKVRIYSATWVSVAR